MTRTARQKRIARQRVTSRACRGKNCPTPKKIAYPSRGEAHASLSHQWQRPRPGKRLPTRAYHCSCGAWHLTTKPDRTSGLGTIRGEALRGGAAGRHHH